MEMQHIGTIVKAANAAQSLSSIISGYGKITEQEKTKRRQITASEKMQCFDTVASSYTEYQIISEQEKTKRREIEAWEKETITKINAQQQLLMEYLERSFDERTENFRSLFAVVDSAIACGDNEQLSLALNSITEIAQSSPFKELANISSVRAALDDPNHVWTI
jgi:ribonucleotide reductase alpha subunit